MTGVCLGVGEAGPGAGPVVHLPQQDAKRPGVHRLRRAHGTSCWTSVFAGLHILPAVLRMNPTMSTAHIESACMQEWIHSPCHIWQSGQQ